MSLIFYKKRSQSYGIQNTLLYSFKGIRRHFYCVYNFSIKKNNSNFKLTTIKARSQANVISISQGQLKKNLKKLLSFITYHSCLVITFPLKKKFDFRHTTFALYFPYYWYYTSVVCILLIQLTDVDRWLIRNCPY